jgi:hypothetical protein
LLTGFQPWPVTQADCLDSNIWWSTIAHLTEPVGAENCRDMDLDLDARAVETLFDALDESRISATSRMAWTVSSPLMSSGAVSATQTNAALRTHPRARPSGGYVAHRGPTDVDDHGARACMPAGLCLVREEFKVGSHSTDCAWSGLVAVEVQQRFPLRQVAGLPTTCAAFIRLIGK